ncbi:hypothetical protein [Paraburkholderia sp. A2RI-6]|uniref:hypothetical protein n=1 Tax=unclassified Paraburkholderia TaxID=2615204 RepID=UPI003B7F66EC
MGVEVKAHEIKLLLSQSIAYTVAIMAIATSIAEAKNSPLSVDAAGEIQLCSENFNCKRIVPTGELKKVIDNGYEHISIADLYNDGNREIVATSGGINECSKFFSFDEKTFKFSPLNFSHRDICNYKIFENNLISSYKLGAKQYEDIYELKMAPINLP